MSAEARPYNPCYIKAWTALSIVLAVILFSAFDNCNHILHFFHPIWNFIRWVFSPII